MEQKLTKSEYDSIRRISNEKYIQTITTRYSYYIPQSDISGGEEVIHRLDGPAYSTIEIETGNLFESYWIIHGNNVDKEIKEWAIGVGVDLDNLTEDDKLLIQLKFGGPI